MLERIIENRLKSRIESLGGRCLKFISPGNKGVPDRIVILPGGRIFFVELKAPGKKLSPLQDLWADRLRSLNCDHWKIDTLEDVEIFVDFVKV